MAQYASGKYAIGECDRCGFVYKLHELQRETGILQNRGLLVCRYCWEPENPQAKFGRNVVIDAQAVRDSKPERRSGDMLNIRWGWNPVYGVEAQGQLGTVTVSTP